MDGCFYVILRRQNGRSRLPKCLFDPKGLCENNRAALWVIFFFLRAVVSAVPHPCVCLTCITCSYTKYFYEHLRFGSSLGNNDVIYYIKCLKIRDFEPLMLIEQVLIKIT